MPGRGLPVLCDVVMGDSEEPLGERTAAGVIAPCGAGGGHERFLDDVGHRRAVAADEAGDVAPHTFAVVLVQQRPRLPIAVLQSAGHGALVP